MATAHEHDPTATAHEHDPTVWRSKEGGQYEKVCWRVLEPEEAHGASDATS